MARTVFTVGHGTLAADELVALLEGPEVEQILDVRAFPGSRHNPHFGRDAMAEWLPAKGIGYGWLPALGGRRKPVEGSIHQALRNDSFRAYADHMETEEFLGGIDDLLAREDEGKPAVMRILRRKASGSWTAGCATTSVSLPRSPTSDPLRRQGTRRLSGSPFVTSTGRRPAFASHGTRRIVIRRRRRRPDEAR